MINLFAAETDNGLVLQTFNLPEDFSVAARFYIGLQHEKKLIVQEISLMDVRKDAALEVYLSQCLEYLNNLQSSSAESSEGTFVWPAFHLIPLNSIASIVACSDIRKQDKEIKLIKQQISFYRTLITLKPRTIAQVVDILSDKNISGVERLERIMSCARVSRSGAEYICNRIPLHEFLNADNTINKRIDTLNDLLAYLEFLKSLTKTLKLTKTDGYKVEGFIRKSVSQISELSELQVSLISELYIMGILPNGNFIKSEKLITRVFAKEKTKFPNIEDYRQALYEMAHRPPHYVDGHGNLGEMGSMDDGRTFFIDAGADVEYTEVRLSERGLNFINENNLKH